MHYYSNGIGHMMGYGYGLAWMILWAAVVIGIAALVGWWFAKSYRNAREYHESPQEILKLRYAHGEISDDEYHKRLDELRR
jgi:putative membrane protein